MAVSQDCAIALQTGQQERNSISKKQNKTTMQQKGDDQNQIDVGLVFHACHLSTLGGQDRRIA